MEIIREDTRYIPAQGFRLRLILLCENIFVFHPEQTMRLGIRKTCNFLKKKNYFNLKKQPAIKVKK